MSIEFINYEGLQIKYLNAEELIIVPLKITQSKIGESGEADLQVFWMSKGNMIEVPPYHVKWMHKSTYIEVAYDKDLNSKMETFMKETKLRPGIEYGIEQYHIGDSGHVSYILWKPYESNKVYDSRKNTRTLKFEENYQKRKKRTTEQYIRDQSAFRRNLLDLDGKCAITRITIPEVLQAAHIVAVKDGGHEVVNNGILLRSDLHLLFDSGKRILKIDPDGYVHIDKRLVDDCQEYMKYDGVKIDDSILERVRCNLERSIKE